MNPHSLAESQYELAEEYSRLSAELGALRAKEALEWLELRKDTTTDKQAQYMYNASPNGMRAMELKFILEGLSKKMSAAKALLRQLSDESRNQY